MAIVTDFLRLRTRGRNTYEITNSVAEALHRSGLTDGTVTVFCRHTSCSLVLMENADPSARHDLHTFMERLVPENLGWYTHTLEGADDTTSHIKMALTRSSEVIPFANGRLLLGTWQGIFLWEHRDAPHNREIVLSFNGE